MRGRDTDRRSSCCPCLLQQPVFSILAARDGMDRLKASFSSFPSGHSFLSPQTEEMAGGQVVAAEGGEPRREGVRLS